MRVLKEVLVLAAIVGVLAYAARQLEGLDAGRLDAGVPSLMQSLEQLWGSEDSAEKKKPEPARPSE